MLRRALLVCLLCGAVHASDMTAVRAAEDAAARAVGAGDARVELPVATPVEVRIARPIDSRTAHAGDVFKLVTTKDVYIGDILAIPAGSEGEGEVLDASAAGIGGKPAELVLAAKFV